MSLFDLGEIKDVLGDIGQVIKEGVGIFKDIKKEVGNGSSSSGAITPPITTSQLPSEIKLSLSDFAFTPNWYLIGLGAALLIFAAILKK